MQEDITITRIEMVMARSRLWATQKDLATKSQLSQTMVSDLESGKKHLRSLELYQYENLLRALELDKIRIQIIEIEQVPEPLSDISPVLTQEN